MEMTYDIVLENLSVGTAVVSTEGLYYCIRCSCRLPGKAMYRIVASCDGKQVDLGICVPRGGSFFLETRLPIKRIGTGELSFYATQKHAQTHINFIPIDPEKPFDHIRQLNKAYFKMQNGQPGVILKD